jgi:hypothetical protein
MPSVSAGELQVMQESSNTLIHPDSISPGEIYVIMRRMLLTLYAKDQQMTNGNLEIKKMNKGKVHTVHLLEL